MTGCAGGAARAEGATRRGERRALTPTLDGAWERVFEQAPTGMWLSEPGPDGRLLRANAALCDLLGRSEAEVLALTKREVFRKEDEADIVAATQALASRAVKGVVLDEQVIRPDGTTRWLRGSACLLDDESGTVALAQFVDVTQLYEAQARHEDDLAFQRAVLAASPDVVSVHSATPRRIRWASAGVTELMGRTLEELQQLEEEGDSGRLFHPEDLETLRRQFDEVIAGPDSGVVEADVRVAVPGRGWRVLQRRCTPFTRDRDGRVNQVLCTSRDVTDAVEAAAERVRSEAFLRAVVLTSPDVVLIVKVPSGRTFWSSRNPLELVGRGEGAETGAWPTWEQLVHEEDRPRVQASLAGLVRAPDGDVTTVRYRARHADGSWRWLENRTTPFRRDEKGVVTEVLTVLSDHTDVVEAQEQLERAALHDPLTGLPNRLLAADRLRTALAAADRHGPVAVLFLDLDGFKRVNDAHGHAAGDALLIEVSGRLARHVRHGDTVARVGGDEFVVVLAERRGEPLELAARDVANRLRRAVAEPVVHAGTEHRVTVSVGLAIGSEPEQAGTLLRDADTAMYRAKTSGKDRLAVFDPSLHAEAVQRSQVERELRAALDEDRIALHFQPQVCAATGEVAGQEALLRLTTRAGEPLSAQDVIAVAEHTGLMAELGGRVLEIACRHAASWPRPVPVAVNLSVRELDDGALSARVLACLARTGLPADRLVLELTETVLLQAGPALIEDLKRLRDADVGIALDDFGTGYASLRYLATLPVTSVKVDRSFTIRIEEDPVSRTLVNATIALARDLGISCVVEGVETEGQRRTIGAQPHVLLQGHFLGHATAEAVFATSRPRDPQEASDRAPSRRADASLLAARPRRGSSR